MHSTCAASIRIMERCCQGRWFKSARSTVPSKKVLAASIVVRGRLAKAQGESSSPLCGCFTFLWPRLFSRLETAFFPLSDFQTFFGETLGPWQVTRQWLLKPWRQRRSPTRRRRSQMRRKQRRQQLRYQWSRLLQESFRLRLLRQSFSQRRNPRTQLPGLADSSLVRFTSGQIYQWYHSP